MNHPAATAIIGKSGYGKIHLERLLHHVESGEIGRLHTVRGLGLWPRPPRIFSATTGRARSKLAAIHDIPADSIRHKPATGAAAGQIHIAWIESSIFRTFVEHRLPAEVGFPCSKPAFRHVFAT